MVLKSTYLIAFLHSLLFAGVSGRLEAAFSASQRYFGVPFTSHTSLCRLLWAPAFVNNLTVSKDNTARKQESRPRFCSELGCLCPSLTHVQYTQTDTIRQTDGPLVPMVRLVPIETDVIPMVLLVNMHLIKGTQIIFPCDLAGYRAIPMVHWYQWYDWYQQKLMSFQWFYW